MAVALAVVLSSKQVGGGVSAPTWPAAANIARRSASFASPRGKFLTSSRQLPPPPPLLPLPPPPPPAGLAPPAAGCLALLPRSGSASRACNAPTL